MKRKFFSLQYKILIFSFFLILVPILTLGIFSYKESLEIVQQKVSVSNLNTVQQVGERIEFIFQDAHDMSLFLIQSDDVREFFKLEKGNTEIDTKTIKLNNYLMYLLSSKPYIYSIYFKGFNGVSMDTKSASNPIDSEMENEIIALRGGFVWNIGEIINFDGSSTNVFSMIRVVNDMYNTPNKLAIMKINVDEKELANIYSDKIMGKQGDFFIVDGENRIISSMDKGRLGQDLNFNLDAAGQKDAKMGYFQTVIGDQDYLVTYYLIDDLNYTLLNLVPLRELLKENTVIPKTMLEVAGISFIVCVLIALLFSINVLRPLKNMRLQMQKVENEDFDVAVRFRGNDEIAMLGRSFTKMSARLKELINQVYITKIKQKEAELSALETQINPHFLYNTLDTIYWMSRMEKAFETSKLIEALAKLFRLSLNNGKELIQLRDEVDHLKNYLIIQKKRYGDAINFNLDVEEDLLDSTVVKLVLQPLVENAIIHGIEKKEGTGNIFVTIKRVAENLIYEIKDDGKGVDVNEINQLLTVVGDSNRGFGIKNINDRLELYFGEQYGIQFSSENGEGTTVTVTQPYIKGDSDHD